MLRRLAVILLCLGSVTRSFGDLMLNFVNDNPNYDANDVYITFFVDGPGNPLFDATINGSPVPLTTGSAEFATQDFHISQSYSLAQLSSGVDIISATSVRFYVTLGAPMATGIGSDTHGSGVLTWGLPSFTNTSDPNWNVRWDAFELTYNNVPADYGDIQSINQYAVPLQIQSFNNGSSTPLQTVRTYQNNPAVLSQLQALATANQANSASGGFDLPANWNVTDSSGNFLRMVGPPSGGLRSTLNPNSYTTVGPSPSFNPYANYVQAHNIQTSLTGTYVDPDSNQSYTYNFVASASPTSSGNAQVVLTGTVTGSTHVYKMVISPDTNVGTATGNYSLSYAIYGAAYQLNPDIQYSIDGVVVTEKTFLDQVSGGQAVINQVFHDFSSGYNYGLVGNDTMITNSAINGGVPISINDMGSEGWRILAQLLESGQISASELNLFSLTDEAGDKLYNQWAAILYAGSPSVYGFAYSDFLQPDLALFSSYYKETEVDSWTATILPDFDAVPEPATWVLLSFGFVLLCWRGYRLSRAA